MARHGRYTTVIEIFVAVCLIAYGILKVADVLSDCKSMISAFAAIWCGLSAVSLQIILRCLNNASQIMWMVLVMLAELAGAILTVVGVVTNRAKGTPFSDPYEMICFLVAGWILILVICSIVRIRIKYLEDNGDSNREHAAAGNEGNYGAQESPNDYVTAQDFTDISTRRPPDEPPPYQYHDSGLPGYELHAGSHPIPMTTHTDSKQMQSSEDRTPHYENYPSIRTRHFNQDLANVDFYADNI